MPTRVVVTGTGTPIVTPDRAGPGVLVSCGDTHLQFDAGRATLLRLAAIGFSPVDLTALFVTHQHSDHLTGLADLLMTRWLEGAADPLPVYAPSGMAADLVQHLLVPWQKEIGMREAHRGYGGHPRPEVHDFDPPPRVSPLFGHDHVDVEVSQVRHEPVSGAVGYRVITPDGVVVISGDTRVCDELAALSENADVLVAEAFLTSALEPGSVSDVDALAAYHAEVSELGTMAADAGVRHLMLSHLIPPPSDEDDEARFEDAIRESGFSGELSVCHDLATTTLN